MLTQQLLFYLFASITVFAGVMVVVANNPVRCALFLVLAFFTTAAIWMLAEAEFLALILILVYVGAVMTLFLFVIMMLNIDVASIQKRFVKYIPIGVLIVGVLTALMFIAIKPEHFGFAHLTQGGLHGPEYKNVEELGEVLYTQFAYPFILAAVLLLVAIISAISLVHRRPQNCKSQNVVDQIRVKRDDRVRLVKMKTEEKKS